MKELKIISEYSRILGANDYSFAQRVYTGGLDKYKERLKAIGFNDLGSVLDAGCGFGQWAFALADINQKVYGTDNSSIRVKLCNDIQQSVKSNVEFSNASLDSQPFENDSMDAVFCYGAIFISDPKKVLNEFFRILKPKGKLYVNANGLGWMLNMWINQPNKTDDYNPREHAVKAFQNTYDYHKYGDRGDGQIIIEKDELIGMVSSAGFDNIRIAGEGQLSINGEVPTPFFKDEYFGQTGIYEILAQKSQ